MGSQRFGDDWATSLQKSLWNLLQHCFCLMFCFIFRGAAQDMWNLSSLTRDWTHIPWTRRQNLNHRTTRKVPSESTLVAYGKQTHTHTGKGGILGLITIPRVRPVEKIREFSKPTQLTQHWSRASDPHVVILKVYALPIMPKSHLIPGPSWSFARRRLKRTESLPFSAQQT